MDFAAHAAALSDAADEHLGDLIEYAVAGESGAPFVPLKGRIFAVEPPTNWAATDEMQGGWRLRIAKDKVPNPSKADRLRCSPILGDGTVYRPGPKNPIDDGRYWLVDLQKV